MAGELSGGNGTSPDASISCKPPVTSWAKMPCPASTEHVPIPSHISRHLHGTAVFDAQPCALITLKEAVWLAVLLLTRTLSIYDVLCSHRFGTSNAVGRPIMNSSVCAI